MRATPPAAGLLLALACAALLRAQEAPSADATIGRLAAEAGQRPPVLRIGLEPAATIAVDAERGFRVIDPASGAEVAEARAPGVLTVMVAAPAAAARGAVFRVQVGAWSDRAAAEAELGRLQAALPGERVLLHHDPDRGTWRVRVGEAAERATLTPLVERLRAAGIADPWIVEEPPEIAAGATLRLVDPTWTALETGAERLVVVPVRGGTVRIGGSPYRGVVELRVAAGGTVRPINWITLESYLRGVVPSELGPEVWPQLEAQKAQAVAARTYAWRNRGQFAAQGFDICATPRCQVYDGRKVEHPLSDRAIVDTAGEILVWDGRPINALYTATCGGHTEDGADVFADQTGPYLKGVPCRAEPEVLSRLRATLVREAAPLAVDETGTDVTRELALLRAAEIVASGEGATDGGPLSPEGLRGLTLALARAAGRPAPLGPPRPAATVREALGALAEDLGWAARARVLLAPEDVPALVRDPRARDLPEPERRALAYLVLREAVRPYPSGELGLDQPSSVRRLAWSLVRIGESYDAFALREGVLAGVAGDVLRIRRGSAEARHPVAGRAVLFALQGGRAHPVRTLELWPGDRIRYRTDTAGAIDLLELAAPVKGASDDRSAAVYSWEVRRTRGEVEQAISRRVDVGRLQDLRVIRRGVSGRIAELEVIGERGRQVVRGFDVRTMLDLRESLVVIEPQRDARGALEAVVFAGKGWGHGVGLCQVGAYGMALRGVRYRDILGHYYRGATIERIAASSR